MQLMTREAYIRFFRKVSKKIFILRNKHIEETICENVIRISGHVLEKSTKNLIPLLFHGFCARYYWEIEIVRLIGDSIAIS